VNVVWGALILVVVTGATVSAMLLMRRRAPQGSYFSDGDRASGVFGVLATGFALVLGFMIFLAFESYDESRSGAEAEASIVAQQVQTAQLLPAHVTAELTGELVCYGRSVAGAEWDAVDAGTFGDGINPWGVEMFSTLKSVKPVTAVEQSAYDRWMDQSLERQQARNDRLRGAEGVIPLPVWVVLFLLSGLIFVYVLFFADPDERAVTQGMLMGSVSVVVTLLMLLLMFFHHPHGDGLGRLQPTAMDRSLRLVQAQIEIVGLDVTPPCDPQGNPL
jgi:protein-S-isoprenylcysteine O-methyltransferase Ste14